MGLEDFSAAPEKDLWAPMRLLDAEQTAALERGRLPSELNEAREQGVRTIGDPERDAQNWHLQSENYSCAVACQEFVAEQLLGREFSEREMISLATRKGWYDPETGMTFKDIGKLLEELGLQVEREIGLRLDDLEQRLKSGAKIICCVNNMVLARPELSWMPGLRANHAVEVIGIQRAGKDVRVILNDPGVESGRGIHIQASTFQKAWKTSGSLAVTARKGGASI